MHKAVTVDMSFMFDDATNVKKESDEAEDELPSGNDPTQDWWRNLALKVEYLKSDRGSRQFYRESFIDLMRTSIEQLATKKWAKSSVSAFVKEVFYNKKGFFSKEQIETIEELMAALNDESVVSTRKCCSDLRQRAQAKPA